MNLPGKLVAVTLTMLFLSLGGACTRNSGNLLAEGIEMHRQENYRGAVVLFKNCLEKNPRETRARYYLADSYLQEGRLDLAEKEFQKLAIQDPDYPGLSLKMAELHLQEGKGEDAQREAERHLELQPGDPEGLRLLGSALMAQKRLEEAEGHFRQALSRKSGYVEAELALADCLARTERNSEARGVLQAILARDEGQVQARFELARLETAEGNREGALREYRRICELDPENAEAFYLTGLLLLEQKDADGAESIADHLLDRFPDRPRGSQLKGFIHYFRGQFEEAVVRLQRTSEMHPDLLTFYMLGMSYYQQGKLELATTQFRRFLDFRPEASHPRIVLAAILIKQKRAEDAIGELQRVLRTDERNAMAHTLLGSAYLEKGEFDRAADQFDQAININPNMVGARLNKGLFSIVRGDLTDGENHLAEALAIAPETAGVRLLLAGHYLREGKYGEAAVILREGLTGNPEDAIMLNYLAAACFGLQREQEAVASLEKAKRLRPDYFVPYYNLAAYHLQKGEYEKAEQQYRELLGRRPGELRALLSLAQTAELAGRRKAAETSYRQAAATGEPDGYLELASFYRRNGRIAEALATLEAAGQKHERNPAILEARGKALFAAGRFEDAAAAFSRLEQTAAGQGLPLLLETHFAMGNPSKAEGLARQIISRSPDEPAGYIALAMVHEKRQEFEEAIRALQDAPTGAKGRLPMRMQLAGLMEKRGRSQEALDLYQSILREQPSFYPALFAIGSFHDRLGERAKAESYYQRTLEAKSDYTPALNNLACLFADRPDRRQQALRLALQAYRAQPGNPVILDTLGYVYWRHGRFEEAKQLLERAVALLPRVPTVHYHLALAYQSLGDRKSSVNSLRSALGLGTFPEVAAARQLLGQATGKAEDYE